MLRAEIACMCKAEGHSATRELENTSMAEVDLLIAARDIVGESIVWDDMTGTLVWVDIGGRRIHRFDMQSGAHRIWPLGYFPTSIGLRTDGGAILGRTRDVVLWDWEGPGDVLALPEADLPGNRLNEGRVAPDGSFWIGTMANNLGTDGSSMAQAGSTGGLYRVAPDGTVVRLTDDRFGITNTMVWLDDGRFITADTVANAVYAYEQTTDGLLGARTDFGTRFDRGLPDGSCRDSEGGVWTCRVVGGAALTRTMPDGRLDRVVELPCSWPTSCTFGGADLDLLFVTSARFTMTAAHLAAHPQEGSVFVLRPGVRGLPENRFGARRP
jgi:sugar lactone lactonase YvrE